MDFLALPPEVNSARMYAGPGSGPLMAAAVAWQGIAAELHRTANGFSATISGLTSQAWRGPSSASMASAALPYVEWMTTAAGQAEQAAAHAQAAAGAFEAAYALTVPPAMIAANRSQLVTLVATNILGQNTPAIAATEAQYAEMWAQDVTAMSSYSASSAVVSNLTPFASPASTAKPAAVTSQKASSIYIAEIGELDLLVTAGVALGSTSLAVAATNLGRSFYRDNLSDIKDAEKAEKDAQKQSSGGNGIGTPGGGPALRNSAGGSRATVGRGLGVVTAATGRGPTIGGLTVPQGWALPPEVRPIVQALPMNGAAATPVVLEEDDVGNPYTGMALTSGIGTAVGSYAGHGALGAANTSARPAVTHPAGADKTTAPAAPAVRFAPITVTNSGAVPVEDTAAQLAAALAAMPGATVVVIPPPAATE